MTLRGLPTTGPVAKQLYRSMKLWCDVGGHVDPRPHVCGGCRQRVCAQHSRWAGPTGAGTPRRLCDDCARKEDRR